MRKNYRKYAIAAVVIILAIFTAKLGTWWWTQREWFELQHRQLATIERLAEFPPAGWDHDRWESALVTPYNVWGNVTYAPNYSNISNNEMRSLQHKLDQILAETTPENSIESVDRVFELLLQRGQKAEFISGYRDDFRSYREVTRQAPNRGKRSSREEDHDPFGDSAADDSPKTTAATFEELVELMESTIGKTERPAPEDPFDPPLTNADISSEESSTRSILDQIVSFVLTSPDLQDEREFYGTAADTRCALISNAGYGVPWPEWYTPKTQGMTFVRASEENRVEPSNRRLLGIRIDKLHRGATTNENNSPLLSGPVEVTLVNAGGDPDDVTVQGGANVHFRIEWKNGKPRLIYDGLHDP